MLVMIDNYDSFTYNIVQVLAAEGYEVVTYRNDAIDLQGLQSLQPKGLLISPGPGRPEGAGVSKEAIAYYAGRIPLLGICLGHQSLAEVFGGNIIRAQRIMHGKTSSMYHSNASIFSGLSQPFIATRYHSLLVESSTLPSSFETLCWTEEDEIMGLLHRPTGALGVQFHPESILSVEGPTLLKNFAGLCT